MNRIPAHPSIHPHWCPDIPIYLCAIIVQLNILNHPCCTRGCKSGEHACVRQSVGMSVIYMEKLTATNKCMHATPHWHALDKGHDTIPDIDRCWRPNAPSGHRPPRKSGARTTRNMCSGVLAGSLRCTRSTGERAAGPDGRDGTNHNPHTNRASAMHYVWLRLG